MALERRAFLVRTGLAFAAGALASAPAWLDDEEAEAASEASSLVTWRDVREEFPLTTDLVHTPAFNVKNYGAKGDGSDATAGIQGALTAARLAGGGTVYVPDGDYLTTADLVIGSKTKLLLAPGAKIRRQATSAIVAGIRNFASGDTDISIEGGTVERLGEATPPNASYDNTVRLSGVTRAKVLGVTARGSGKTIHLEGCTDYLIQGCSALDFVDNGIAVNWNGISSSTPAGGRIIGNFVDTPSATGFVVGASGIICTQSGVVIAHNVLRDQAHNIIELGGYQTGIYNLSVVGNIGLWTGKADVNNNIISTDLVHESQMTDNILQHGAIIIDTLDHANSWNDGYTVARNTVIGTSTFNVAVGVRHCTRALVAHNRAIYGQIIVQSSSDVDVLDNAAFNAAGAGILLVGQPAPSPYPNRRIRLRGNGAVDCGRALTPGLRQGFLVDGGDRISLDGGNYAYDTGGGTQQYGLYVNAVTNLLEEGNNWRGNAVGEYQAFAGTVTRIWRSGQEIARAQATTSIGVTATTEASADAVVTAPAVTFDGATEIEVEFFCPRADSNAQGISFILFDGGSPVGRLADYSSTAADLDAPYVRYRFTPSAGTHTYSIRCFITAGTGTVTVRAGSGGAGDFVPTFMRLVMA